MAAPAGWIVGWGYNESGEATGIPSGYGYTAGTVTLDGLMVSNATAIAAGFGYGLALLEDGTVMGWGGNGMGAATGSRTENKPYCGHGKVMIDGSILSNVVVIAAGFTHSQAIRKDGTVVTWGSPEPYLTNSIRAASGLSNVVSVAGGFSLAAKSDGTVVNLINGETYAGLTNVAAVSASWRDHGPLVVLKTNGTVVETDLQGNETPVSVNVSNVVAISAGGENLALKKDGTVFGWGYGSSLPGGLTNIMAISAGERHSLALKCDGSIVSWGYYRPQVLVVPEGLSNVVAIAAGNDFFLAITTNRAVAERFRQK